MADLVQTPANVKIGGSDAVVRVVQAGEAITQGMPCYQNTSTGKYFKTDADTLAASLAAGVALTPAATDGYFVLQVSGDINLGGTLVVGSEYYCSTNAGGIGLIAELASGDYPTRLGFAESTSVLALKIVSAGVAKA